MKEMKKLKKIWGIITASLTVLSLTACAKITHTGNSNTGKQISKVLNKSSFSSLIIDSEASDVIVKTGKEYSVRYKGGQKIKPRIENKNGQLIIKQKGDSNNDPSIVITVPSDNKINQVDIKSEAGDINVNDIELQTAQLNTQEGDLVVEGATLNNGQLNAEEGDVNLSDVVAKTGTTIKSEQGDVVVSSSNYKGYNLATEEGSISVLGHSYASSSYKKKSNVKNVLKVESEEGDITVK